MNKLRVISASLDRAALTLYLENGSTVEIPQGDSELSRIVSEVMPTITTGKIAEVARYTDAAVTHNDGLVALEKKSNGLVRFFRVAKAALAELLAPEEPKAGAAAEAPPANQNLQQACAEIILRAEPVVKETVEVVAPIEDNDSVSPDNHTIVAVLGDTLVPGIENIQKQIDHSQLSEGGTDSEGMTNFLRRLGAVIKERRHSVDDLLKFMRCGDLPVTRAGDIIIYKVLRRKNGAYVDCYTGKVPQKVGSRVCMAHSLVDHDRKHECSNGLHVARRQYIGRFSGDVCVVALVAPEDVIAVPQYDSNKMRVCGYHIVHELSHAHYALLKENKAITETVDGQKLLADIYEGRHTPITEIVEITQQQGEGCVITPVQSRIASASKPGVPATSAKPEEIVKTVKAVKAISLERKEKKIAPTVDPKKIAAAVGKQKGILPENPDHLNALLLVRKGMSVSAASRESGVHRRTIDRLIERHGLKDSAQK